MTPPATMQSEAMGRSGAMTHVTIREVALRDGLQIEKPIPLSAKLELLAAVAATGVREIEATAFVSPSKVPSMADAAELAAHLHDYPDIDFSALVASPNGAKRAVAAGLRSIEYVVAASDAFSQANVGRSYAQATEQIGEIVAIAHDSDVSVEVIVATAWDCPFDGPTPPQRVLDIGSAAVEYGADRFSIADTIGTTTPGRVRALIGQLHPVIGDLPLGGHFHNTRGAGLASAYAAVESGVTRLDASAGGLGGCPFAPGATGNIATEDLVYLLRDSGVDTDIDLDAAIAAAGVAKTVVDHDLPSALLRAGDRKHAH
jgi:hydroxymethylglutaryl-CoA lyase